jgi:hypothetical protein
VGEKIRRAVDLEHWAAFGVSLNRIVSLMREVGTGAHGKRAPATIVALSGDVHHAYLATVGWPRGTNMSSAVFQATCSPFRNPLDEKERRMIRFCCSRAGTRVGRVLARRARVEDPPVRWRFTGDAPYFDNQVCFIELRGRSARLWLQKTVPGENDGYSLETVYEAGLT